MSDSRRSKIFAVRPSQVISSFCFAVGFWEVQSINSQNLQNTNYILIMSSMNISRIPLVLSQKFLEPEGTTDLPNQFIWQPQTGLCFMWQSARANQWVRIQKHCHGNRWLTSTKNTFGHWEKFLERHVLEKTAVKWKREKAGGMVQCMIQGVQKIKPWTGWRRNYIDIKPVLCAL